MKKSIKIITSSFALLVALSSCASVSEQSNDYFGYSNKPAYEEPKPIAVTQETYTYEPEVQYAPVVNSPEPIQTYTVVEPEYVYFNPVVYHGYYPWWAPPQRFQVVQAYNPGFSVSIGYSNYSIWDDYYYYHGYPQYNYYYGYSYYPYPVYQPYHYSHHYPPYYGGGWYNVPNYGSSRPRHDRSNETYRDFGTSRGGYGFASPRTETSAPANRRSGTTAVPATRPGTRSIYDNNPVSTGNQRSGTGNVRSSERSGSAVTVPTGVNANAPRGDEHINSGRGSAIRGETPANRRSPASENTSPVRESDRGTSGNYDTPRRETSPAPRQEAPRREAAPAPRQEAPRREAAPERSSSPAPSRESSRPSSNDDSKSNRRSR